WFNAAASKRGAGRGRSLRTSLPKKLPERSVYATGARARRKIVTQEMNLRFVVWACARLVWDGFFEVNDRQGYLSYGRFVRVLGVTLVSYCVVLTTLSVEAVAQTDARAARPPVEFVRQAVESEFGEEIAVRIVGELQALGFEVVLSQGETASED